MPIPPLSTSGLLPPFVGDPRVDASHAPYRATMAELVAAYGHSPRRQRLLASLLHLRYAVREVCGDVGEVWIDGSFTTVKRDPGDIDGCLVIDVPISPETAAKLWDICEFWRSLPEGDKLDFYPILLEGDLADYRRAVTFWHGFWSHNRDGVWRGYLVVELNALGGQDENAASLLGMPPRDGGHHAAQ